MSQQLWTDQELVSAIQQGGQQRENAFRHLCSNMAWRQSVLKVVLKQGGNPLVADEVFIETLCELDKNIRANQFNGAAKLKSYYLTIVSRYHLRKKAKERKHETITLPPGDAALNQAPRQLLTEDQQKYLGLLLTKVGDRCKEIMRLRHLHYSHEEIAAKVESLSGAAAAKREYARCKSRLKNIIQDHPGWQQLLKDIRWL